MKFSFKIKNLKKYRIENQRFHNWIVDDANDVLFLFDDEINFSTFILKGAIQLESIKLSKIKNKIVADITFNKWSKYFIGIILGGFYTVCLFHAPKGDVLRMLVGLILLNLLMFLVAYPILRIDIEKAITKNPKR